MGQSNLTKLTHPFKPVVFKDSKYLILGSFPSIDSFENSFYYGHNRNQFWKILSAITNYPINNIDQKIWLLKRSNIALWDMIKSCNRENSLDSSLKDIEVNNIEELLKNYPNIKKVLFTGRLAERLFKKYFSHLDIKTAYLPSPSTAYAKMSLDDKIKVYAKELGREYGSLGNR